MQLAHLEKMLLMVPWLELCHWKHNSTYKHLKMSEMLLVLPWHSYRNESLSTYLQASLGWSCQLLGPVMAEPPSLSQLLLQLLLPSGQCWIGAARKEPVILNQFCATGKGVCWLDWGCIYGWEVGIKWVGQHDGRVKEDILWRQDDRGGE